MRWIMRFFGRTPPPERSTRTADRDPEAMQARQAYQQDKQAALQKQVELLARLQRMGYDVDVTRRRDSPDEPMEMM